MTQQLPSDPPTGPLGASAVSGNPVGSGELGRVVIVLAVALTVIHWLSAAAATLAYGESTVDGPPVWVLAYAALSALLLLVLIATYVLTAIWLSRARRNADLIAPDQQRWSKAWVWLGWIVPVVSYWCPKQVIDDVWRSTVRDPGEPSTRWWWGTWIAANVIGLVGTLTSGDLTSGGGDAVTEWTTAVVITVAMVFWIRVVRTVSQAQDALAGAGVAPS